MFLISGLSIVQTYLNLASVTYPLAFLSHRSQTHLNEIGVCALGRITDQHKVGLLRVGDKSNDGSILGYGIAVTLVM
jgi:hypothetical protein